MELRRTSLIALLGIALFAPAFADPDPAAQAWAAAQPSGPQGRTQAEIAQLPDWSGAWWLDGLSRIKTLRSRQSRNLNDPWVPRLSQRWSDYRLADSAANNGMGNPNAPPNNSAKCIPEGMPGVMVTPMQFEFLFSPGRVTMIASDNEVRRITTDGRRHNPKNTLHFLGDSIGVWQGQTLVVDTIDILPGAELFRDLPEPAGTHVVEKIYLKNPTTLVDDFIVTNSEMLDAPWIFERSYVRAPVFYPAVCQENNREAGGVVDLTPP